MKTFDKLRKEHNHLIDLQKQDINSEELLIEAIGFVEHARNSSAKIFFPAKRDQLRTIIRYWAAFIHNNDPNETNAYPVTDLLPFAGFQIRSGNNLSGLIMVFIIIIIFLIISFLVFQGKITSISETTPASNKTFSISSIIAADTATAKAVSSGAITETQVMTGTKTPTSTKITEGITSTFVAPGSTPTSVAALPQFSLTSPMNGDEINPETTFQGTYANLKPGWSIHILIQPLSRSGKYYPLPDYFSIPKNAPEGDWSITCQFQDQFMIEVPDTYIITMLVATNEALQNSLSEAILTGLDDIPASAVAIENHPITVKRKAYRWINETRLVYSSIDNIDGQADIFSAKPDGTDIQQITYTMELSETFPSLSPDGRKIAFVGVQMDGNDKHYSIWLMDSNGQNRHMLLSEKNIIYETPVWSPDSSFLAYSAINSEADINVWGLYIYNVINRVPIDQISNPLLISDQNSQSNSTTNRFPTWLDNENLVFYRKLNSSEAVISVNIYSFQEKTLLDQQTLITQPSISPGGDQIAYVATSESSEKGSEIFITDLNTSLQKELTESPGQVFFPHWTPDNKSIFYIAKITKSSEIWSVNIDGSNQRKAIYQDGASCTHPYVGHMNTYLPLAQ